MAHPTSTPHARPCSYVLLDPLVRMHRIDENSSADVSALLRLLRTLQRQIPM